MPPQLFRAGQAFVVERGERRYRFQINMIDLATGVKSADLTLMIPFGGDFPTPKYGSFAGDKAWTHSPHLLGIGGLQAEGNVLRIIMKPDADSLGVNTDSPKTALEFDLKPLLTPTKTD